jgi:hypothetical protein
MTETVKEFANMGPAVKERLLGNQVQWLQGIAKGPLKLDDWHEFVAWAVQMEIKDKGVTEVDIPQLYAIWLRASITFIEMGKIIMPPPKEPKRPERA